ncbi:sensor histidine kinase [Psychrobacillus glaciei]|uniref:histidine kinase n=1 Tax=Psychrobacillus glaciei TaxID=2283160 RepID=A0A5J6SRL9_9BACI|nr:HAMP domain-containing sensor histidine kinase [Psychrobacillus glaciei]QFG00652.1 sensor histidine kinase [Psychrobacillus glaciei]
MYRNQMIKKQQNRLALLNFVAFTIIFSIFSFIIYQLVEGTLYSSVDNELKMAKQMEERPGNRPPRPFNPRMIVLVRDDAGNILNGEQIGTRFLNDFSGDIPFLPDTVDSIQTTKIGSDYVFRSLLYENSNGTFTELLISIEAEQNVIGNFIEILATCTIIFVLLSITASYVLAKRSMKPIINSWNKQSEFVENASHELRTPLTIIQSKLEHLLTKPNATIMEQFESIGLSLSETRRMTKMTSNLLTLARADSLEQQLQKESVNISELVTEVAQPFIEMAELEEKELIVQTHNDHAILADKVRIHQLLIILLDNALKYTNATDKIYIVVKNVPEQVIIEVNDTGIGIKPENLPRVFDRFYREDTARAFESAGTGLGLSIAQWIVESHNGSIHVFSNRQKGTVFQVTLPANR